METTIRSASDTITITAPEPSPTEREIELVRMLANGMSRVEISILVSRSNRTIEANIGDLRVKYDCSSVAQLVAKFLRNSFIN